MKLPMKLGSARTDKLNGGEFYVIRDADGVWIGDIRAEHANEIVMALNTPRPEALEKDADLLATIEKLVREGGKRYPCFDEDEFLAAVRSRFALSPRGEPSPTCSSVTGVCLSPRACDYHGKCKHDQSQPQHGESK